MLPANRPAGSSEVIVERVPSSPNACLQKSKLGLGNYRTFNFLSDRFGAARSLADLQLETGVRPPDRAPS